MIKETISALTFFLLPLSALAQEQADGPSNPDFVFLLGLGATAEPTYFGSDEYEVSPDFVFGFQFLRVPGFRDFGSPDSSEKFGFGPRGSVRVVKERNSSDHDELKGLADVDMSIEIGLGLGYRQRNFRAFADARYGLTGHNAWVGELAADYVARPTSELTLTVGPRLFLGSDDYAQTYFGVSDSESAASGRRYDTFKASGGAMRAGVELSAYYALSENWGLVGSGRWENLLNDAARSPITKQGSTDQFVLSFGVTRLVSFDF